MLTLSRVVFWFVFQLSSVSFARLEEYILKGKALSSIQMAPWNVKLLGGCSGSIIGRRYILTAAHCLCFMKRIKNYIIATGTTGADGRRPVYYEVVSTYKARKFDVPCRHRIRKTISLLHVPMDFAILEVDEDIRFNEYTKAIEYENETIPLKGSIVYAMGFGLDDKNKSEILNYVALKLEMCYERGMNVLCTQKVNGSIYHGDSGGPLVHCPENTIDSCRQIGINVAYTLHYSYYSSTVFHKQFILDSLTQRCDPKRRRTYGGVCELTPMAQGYGAGASSLFRSRKLLVELFWFPVVVTACHLTAANM